MYVWVEMAYKLVQTRLQLHINVPMMKMSRFSKKMLLIFFQSLVSEVIGDECVVVDSKK